jgi:hypothetical protein
MKKTIIALTAIGVAMLGAKVSADTNMNRLYNPNSGEHFYTASTGEKNSLVKVGWKDEGIGWTAPDSGEAVYRVYNPNAKGGDHYYTKNLSEAQGLVKLGWHWDNDAKPVFYSGGSVNVYVAYNPNAQSGSHNYTTDLNEEDHLISVGWKYKAVAWNGVGPNGKPPTSNRKIITVEEIKQKLSSMGYVYRGTVNSYDGDGSDHGQLTWHFMQNIANDWDDTFHEAYPNSFYWDSLFMTYESETEWKTSYYVIFNQYGSLTDATNSEDDQEHKKLALLTGDDFQAGDWIMYYQKVNYDNPNNSYMEPAEGVMKITDVNEISTYMNEHAFLSSVQ